MATGSVSIVASIGGLSIPISVSRTEEGQIGQEVSLPAAKAITSWTKTDDDTGVATVAAGHGFMIGHTVDVYWGTTNVRYQLTVTAVTSTTVTVDGGGGDSFPASATSGMVISKVTQLDVNVDADLAAIIVAGCNKRSHVHFASSESSGVADTLDAQHIPANEGYLWWSNSGISNPLTGDPIDAVEVSNADTVGAATFKLGILYDSVVF